MSWDTALRTFVDRMKAIQAAHGPQSVAFLSTGQIVTEEMALLGALAKFGMGMLHGDGNTRQCMATSVVAYKQAFGFDAPPYTYADFEESDVIVLVGSNLCIAHPILWQRVMRNPHQPEIIVIDPRATETVDGGDAASGRSIPKSDLTLLYGIARHAHRARLDRPRLHRRSHQRLRRVRRIRRRRSRSIASPRKRACRPRRSSSFARTIHEGKRVSFWWTMGVNQSHQAVRTAQAIINLALMTGNIGRPGTGANSITGQCNAMGSRLFSNTTNLLGGHDFANPAHRRKVADVLGIDEAAIPHEASWPYHRILEGILRGEIRGLWIVATNPAHSWINQGMARDVLERLDFLVVQDMYHTTETAQLADLVLPAAGWGEKEGTFINSERRIGVVTQSRPRAGRGARRFPHLQARRRLLGLRRDVSPNGNRPKPCFRLLKQLSRRPAVRHHGHRRLRDARPNAAASNGRIPQRSNGAADAGSRERRLFEDGQFYHADGRARFICESPRPLPEQPNRKYPFVLLTGRGSAAQWHTQTRTAKSAVLRKLYPQELYVEINPHDAAAAWHPLRRPRRRCIAARPTAWPRARHARRPTGPGLHPDALRSDEPA